MEQAEDYRIKSRFENISATVADLIEKDCKYYQLQENKKNTKNYHFILILMEEKIMTDKEKAIEVILTFLNDENKKTLLVRGYDNDAKLRDILACLNRAFNKGIIRTSSMSDISFHINRAFNDKLLPHAVRSTTNYKLGNMVVKINSYVTHTRSNLKGNENTFTLYHPVQTVLDDSKRYSKFLEEVKNTESRKVILVTTNEWSIDNLDIENHVDEVFFYSVENDNPQIMKNLRNNRAIL